MRFPKFLVISVVIAAMLCAGYSAAAAMPAPTYYLALGDSLSQGYMPGLGNTHQGYVDDVYRVLLTRQPGLQLVKLGCSGETTTSMRYGGVCAYPGSVSQLAAAEAFLSSHRGAVVEVTLDIGANDLNHCTSGLVIDPGCVAEGLRTIAGNLFAILAGLRPASAHVPVFEGMTYYDPYLAAWLAGTTGLRTARESVIITNALNAIESAEYAVFGVRIADVSAAFRTNDFSRPAGQLPVNVANICRLTFMCAIGNIHPNLAGYQLIADTFVG
jgi:lysophospholipase L1-like esterase